jgi:hypothetical protein
MIVPIDGYPLQNFLGDRGLRSRNLYALLVIAIVVMASMVVVLRGRSQQTTVPNVSNLNSLESANYIRLNNTIWLDPLTDTSQWHVGYSQLNMTSSISANGALQMNATFASESYPQAVNLYRSVNFSLAQNPVLLISLEASLGIHYGIRIEGQESSGTPFQAWSESSYLQHRIGLGLTENFTINAVVEAFKVNGIFSAAGSRITSLLFYIEATPSQTGQFALNVYGLKVVAPNQYPFNTVNQVQDTIDEITLTLNSTNNLGYTDNQFAQGYIDYYVRGTPDLDYTVYYMHGLTVIGQGFEYSARSLTYNIAAFSASKITSYPPLLTGNNTFLIVLSPIKGSFLSFQLGGFSVRYLSQAPSTTAPTELDPSIILAYYLIFLFVTPVAIVILVSRLFSNETNQVS